MKTRKRGGGKGKPGSNDAFKSSKGSAASIIVPSRFNDPNLSFQKDAQLTINSQPSKHYIDDIKMYYNPMRPKDFTIRTPISDEEYVKRQKNATFYHANYDAPIVDKTIYSNRFSSQGAQQNYIKILNKMKKNNFEEIKEKIKSKGVPDISDSDIRAIAKQHCDENERPEIAHIIGKFSEEQQVAIMKTMNEYVEPNEGDASKSWCSIMGGKNRRTRKPRKLRKKQTKSRRKTHNRRLFKSNKG